MTVRWAERVLALLLALWSLASLAVVVASSGIAVSNLSGGEALPADQFQYMAWIRESSSRLLVSNLYDAAATRPVFLHPLAAGSGLLVRFGLDIRLALLLWKPLAIAALVIGARRWCGALIEDRWERVGALALALFMGPPVAWIVSATDAGDARLERELLGITGETTAAAWLWGYAPTAIAVGLMAIALVALVGAAENTVPTRRATLVAAGAGVLVSWLHPWQGVTLVLLLGVVSVTRRSAVARLAPIGVAWLIPLVAYRVLPAVSVPWAVAEAQNRVPRWSLGALLLGLGPLVLLAVIGWSATAKPRRLLDVVLLAWVPAAALTYFVTPSFALHAWEGISFPLAVLLVRGARRLRITGAVAAGLVVVLTVPGLALLARQMQRVVHHHATLHAFTDDELEAFAWLRQRSDRGVVLAPSIYGAAVPGFTGHETWVGHLSWTPHFGARASRSEAFFERDMTQQEAEEFVATTRATYVFTPCGRAPRMGSTVQLHRFGCVEIAELR